MELREYLSIRRAHNLIRQQLPSKERLTFLELAILCRMHLLKRAMNTSEIADYQGALRPTMTHRTKHLSSLGYIARVKGTDDKRNVQCTITDEGVAYIGRACKDMCDKLNGEEGAERVSVRRMERIVEAMGTLTLLSSDIVLLGILGSRDATGDGQLHVSDLVKLLGLLQPTVSMSISALEKEGLVRRDSGVRASCVELSDEGLARAEGLRVQIEGIVIKR